MRKTVNALNNVNASKKSIHANITQILMWIINYKDKVDIS